MESETCCVCFFAVDIRRKTTELYVFPAVDLKYSLRTLPHPLSFTMVSLDSTSAIEKLTPLSTSYISPRISFGFNIVVGSKICVIGSHVCPDLKQVNPACSILDCFREFAPYTPSSCHHRRPLPPDCPGRLRHLYTFDLEHPESGWMEGPLMGSDHGCNPHPIALDGKIHVVGGKKGPAFHEVFDPELSPQRWKLLPPPPLLWHQDTEGVTHLSAVVDNPKRIIVSTPVAKNFYLYDVCHGDWSILPIPSSSSRRSRHFISGRAAVVEQTLFWFDYQKYKLVAFDLEQKKWLRGRVDGLDVSTDFDSSCFPVLMHVRDNLLCLLWTTRKSDVPVVPPPNIDLDSDDSDYENNNVVVDDPVPVHVTQTIIHCAKVRVSKKIPHLKGHYGLSAVTESRKCYVLDHPIRFEDAFMM